VCHEPIVEEKDIPVHLRDKIYRPAPGEKYNTEIKFEREGESSFGQPQREEVEVEPE
jgi:hypothetical protein